PERERTRVTEFLGELVDVPFSDDVSVQLRTARQDAMVMGDQIRRAWEDLLAAECRVHPVVFVLEDLHWGDLPSAQLIDHALRNLRNERLLVLALARPEVEERFPKLWAGRSLSRMNLNELSRRASEELARDVLGSDFPQATMARIIEHA